MKRLLAYLFIILGLGLTFNDSAEAEAETTVKLVFKGQYVCLEGDTNCGQFSSGPISFHKWKSRKTSFNENGLCMSPEFGTVFYLHTIDNCDHYEKTYSVKYYKLTNLKDNIFRINGYTGKIAIDKFSDPTGLGEGSSVVKKVKKEKNESQLTKVSAGKHFCITEWPKNIPYPKNHLGNYTVPISEILYVRKFKKDNHYDCKLKIYQSNNKPFYSRLLKSIYFWWENKDNPIDDGYGYKGEEPMYFISYKSVNKIINDLNLSIAKIKIDKTKTQIAKAEPSQTQKVAEKDIKFCVNESSINAFGHLVNKHEQNSLCEGIDFVVTKNSNSGLYAYLKKQYIKNNGIFYIKPLLLDKYVRNNKVIKQKKKVEVAKKEPQQEEFKPKKTNQDNEAPVIEIAETITVDSQAYTLKGKVKDKSRFQLTIDDRPIKVAENGQFEFEGFAIDSKEQLKIVAIDRWKNKSEKIVNVEVKIKQVADLRSYEKPNPSKIKVKKDNNKIGIIIGIEKYQNLNNIDAPYANRDAKAFKAYANIALGIPNNNLKVLIDEDATRGELLKSLKIWLPQITRGKEKDIYIFFAGHGLASDNGEDLHILPHNGDPILLEDTALSRVEMFDLINKVSPKSVTMFFDTCYSGQTRSEQMLVAGLRPVRIVANEQDTPNNFTIFTASNYDQTSGSINEAEHGIFSYYLMLGLEGKADENSDKKITNGELISYLKNNVTQEAFSQNRSQEPMLSGDPDKVLISFK